MKASIEFVPNDIWIGAYWRTKNNTFNIWLCLIPMIPLHLSWEIDRRRYNSRRFQRSPLTHLVCLLSGGECDGYGECYWFPTPECADHAAFLLDAYGLRSQSFYDDLEDIPF